MGALIEKNGKARVLEYIDLDPSQEYKYAYSGQLAFDFSFFCKMGKMELPIHWVRKEMDGQTVWKGETFIFDVFSYARKVHPFYVNRKTHYAPIKGPQHIPAVQSALRKLR
jgi:UDP-N-acetylglucosamine pyrophosphorylase